MKAKLLALLAMIQGLLGKLQLKGALVGLAAGYLFHPIIKVGLDLVLLVVRGLFKL